MAAVIKGVERTAFRASRALDFASREELTRETGQQLDRWPLVIVKELVDNALDACEEASIAPVIAVIVDDQGIEVADNGPGISTVDIQGGNGLAGLRERLANVGGRLIARPLGEGGFLVRAETAR